jgi:hypothetical protein
MMSRRVECYAGYRGEQEPVAFWLGERRLAVREIVDRWFGPTHRWFKVNAEDGDLMGHCRVPARRSLTGTRP